jgi:ankyrin repeat protein
MVKLPYIFTLFALFAGCAGAVVREEPVSQPVREHAVKQANSLATKAKQDADDARRRELDRIWELIQFLGHDEWRVRENATQKLLKIGHKGTGLLVAGTYHDDIEIRERSKRVLEGIKKKYAAARREFEKAMKANNLKEVKKILSEELLSLRAVTLEGITYLHIATQAGSSDVAEYFVKKGLEVNAKAKGDTTPLHMAASGQVAQMLIENGADIEAKTTAGDTPLILAVARGRDKVAKVLVASGADVNAATSSSATALHLAANRGSVKVCEMLLENGAEINAKDSCGKTPLDCAWDRHNEEILTKLWSRGAEFSDEVLNFGYAARDNNIEKMSKYLDRGADVDAKVFCDKTLLHRVALLGEKEVAEFLLKRGASVSATAEAGETPLHFAAAEGNGEIMKLLLKAGADVNARDKLGGTPLHEAVLWGKKEMVDFLVTQGANINSRDNSGQTPLDQVGDEEDSELAQLLRSRGARTAEELKQQEK